MNNEIIEKLDIADLFSGWTNKIQDGEDVDKVIDLAELEREFERIEKHFPGMFFAHDFRTITYCYFSRNGGKLGIDYQKYQGASLSEGISFFNSDDLNRIIVAQQEAQSLVQQVPIECRMTYSYTFLVRHNFNSDFYTVNQNTLRPLVLDKYGNTVIDYAEWRETSPKIGLLDKSDFWWEFSYIKDGERIYLKK